MAQIGVRAGDFTAGRKQWSDGVTRGMVVVGGGDCEISLVVGSVVTVTPDREAVVREMQEWLARHGYLAQRQPWILRRT